MILSWMLFLNLLVLYGFLLSKKNLNVLEICGCWMFLTLLRQNFNVIIWVNLGLIKVSQTLSLYWAVCFNRLLLFPLLEVWFLNQYFGANTWKKKGFIFLAFLFLLTGMNGFTVRLGLIQYVHWTIWWSILFWACSMIAGIFILQGFRKVLFSERQRL